MAFLNRRPIPLPTQLADATAAGYTFHLSGELVPVLTVELAPGQSIFFEHHILLWKEPAVQISVRPLAGMLKRMIAGMQILITEARGPGQIAVSRDGVGQIFPIVLGPGQELHVREHQFLAGTSTIDYTWERVSGIANMLFGGTGFLSTVSTPPAARVSSGCMATATCSKRTWHRASRSMSSPAAGCIKTRRCSWKRTSPACRPASSPAAASRSTALPGRAGSDCNPPRPC